MKIKLCIIVTNAVSFNFLMRGQLEYLSSLDKYEITLISGGDEKQIIDLQERDVGRYIYFPFSRDVDLRNDFLCLFKLIVFFTFNRFDVVVYSTPKALLFGSVCSFIQLQRKRIAIVRGRVYENYSGKKRGFFKLLDKLSLSISSNCIFISKSLQQKFIEENIISSKRTKVLHHGSSNGLDINWINSQLNQAYLDSLKNKIAFKDSDFITVSVGRVCIDKGIIEISEIFESLKADPNYKLIIVGRAEDEISKHIIKKLKKFKNFFYFDQVKDVRYFFMLADLHLFLSHREGFGNVALEAAGFNVPTFGFDVVGIKDSICDGVSGKLFPFKDTEQILKEVKYYINSKVELRKTYSKSADWAMKNFRSTIVWDAYDKEFSK